MSRKSNAQKENELLQDRLKCLDLKISDFIPWSCKNKIKDASEELGKLFVAQYRIHKSIDKQLEIKYKNEKMLEEYIKLKSIIKTSEEYYKSEAFLMECPNYKWGDIPKLTNKDTIDDDVVIGYISEKYGQLNAMQIRMFLDKIKGLS